MHDYNNESVITPTERIANALRERSGVPNNTDNPSDDRMKAHDILQTMENSTSALMHDATTN